MAFRRNRIEKILQSCLDRIDKRQDIIDSFLSGYPADLADQIRPGLEAALWLIERRSLLDPRPGYVSASRHRLVATVRRANAAKPLAQAAGERRRFIWAVWPSRMIFHLALLLIVLVSLFVGGSGVAFAMQASLPGDSLYPLKITVERTELVVTRDAEAEARLYIRFAHRRMAEIQLLVLEGSYERIPDTVTMFEHQVGQATKAVNILARSETSRAKVLASSLWKTLSKQVNTITLLSEIVPDQTGLEIERTLRATEQGVFAVQALLIDDPDFGTPTPTPTPTNTDTPDIPGVLLPASETPVPSQTPTPTETLTPTPTQTQTPTPTLSYSFTPTATIKTRKPRGIETPIMATPTTAIIPPVPTNTPQPAPPPTTEPTLPPYPSP